MIILLIPICSVSARFHQHNPFGTNYSLKKAAIITVNNAGLGELREGETKIYTKHTVPELGEAISITTRKENVFLHLVSDLNSKTTYSTYDITIKFATAPEGSNHSPGETACTLTIDSPDYSSINLDVAGRWTFDLNITTSANSVDEGSHTKVTLMMYAQREYEK